MVTLPLQVQVFLQGLAALDDLIQLLDVIAFQCQGKTDSVETAVATIDLEIVIARLSRCFPGLGEMDRHDNFPWLGTQ